MHDRQCVCPQKLPNVIIVIVQALYDESRLAVQGLVKLYTVIYTSNINSPIPLCDELTKKTMFFRYMMLLC